MQTIEIEWRLGISMGRRVRVAGIPVGNWNVRWRVLTGKVHNRVCVFVCGKYVWIRAPSANPMQCGSPAVTWNRFCLRREWVKASAIAVQPCCAYRIPAAEPLNTRGIVMEPLRWSWSAWRLAPWPVVARRRGGGRAAGSRAGHAGRVACKSAIGYLDSATTVGAVRRMNCFRPCPAGAFFCARSER